MDCEAPTANQPSELTPVPARRRIRGLSIRVLMMLVLAMAVVLGWVTYQARIQRDTVAAIRAAGGRAVYSWSREQGRLAPPKYPWLARQLGPDFFEDVTQVDLDATPRGRRLHVDEPLILQVSRLPKLQGLTLNCAEVSNAGLAPIRRIPDLRSLDLIRSAVACPVD